MVKQGHLGTLEIFSIMFVYQVVTLFYNLPAAYAARAKTGAWFLAGETMLLGPVLFIPLYLVLKKFPGKSLVEIVAELLGKFAGMACGMLISGFYLYQLMVILRASGDATVSTMLWTTPLSAIIGLYIIMCIVVAYLGLEALTRVGLIFLPFLLLGGMLVPLLSIPNINFDALYPILGVPLLDHAKSATQLALVVDGTFFLGLWAPYFRQEKGLYKLVFSVFAVGTLISVVTMLTISSVIPYPGDTLIPLPLYQVARMIYFSRFVQRVESLFLILAVVVSALYSATLFSNSVLALAQGLNISDWRPLIFPTAMIGVAIAFLPENSVEIGKWYYSLSNALLIGSITLGLPLLIYLLSLFKGKKGGKQLESETKTG